MLKRSMAMGDLNNDWVLWGSILAVVLTIVSLVGFAWRAIQGMEGEAGEEAGEEDSSK